MLCQDKKSKFCQLISYINEIKKLENVNDVPEEIHLVLYLKGGKLLYL